MCYAIPAFLVSLGFGTAVAGITDALPWLLPLTRHKEWLFGVSALLLAAGGRMLHRPGRTCPSDPDLARSCAALESWSVRIW